MRFFNSIISLFQRAFTWVDWVLDHYTTVRNALPGLVEYIEHLYSMFVPQIENGVMTREEARRELIKTVEQTGTPNDAYGSVIPKPVIAYILELVHMKHTLGHIAPYDNPAIAAQARQALKGLHNKYGDR